MPSAAEAVHGLSSQFLSDKPLFRGGWAELMDFLEDAPLVAHNARFDFGFLNHELKLCARDTVSMDRMIDTVAIARTLHPGAKHSLDAPCPALGERVTLCLTILDFDDLRGALKPDARGLTERGDLAALQTLLDAPEP